MVSHVRRKYLVLWRMLARSCIHAFLTLMSNTRSKHNLRDIGADFGLPFKGRLLFDWTILLSDLVTTGHHSIPFFASLQTSKPNLNISPSPGYPKRSPKTADLISHSGWPPLASPIKEAGRNWKLGAKNSGVEIRRMELFGFERVL